MLVTCGLTSHDHSTSSQVGRGSSPLTSLALSVCKGVKGVMAAGICSGLFVRRFDCPYPWMVKTVKL